MAQRRTLVNLFWTQSGAKKEVLAVVDAVSAAGVNSIPTLVIDGQHVISPTAGTEEVLGGLRRAVQGGLQGHRALAVPVF